MIDYAERVTEMANAAEGKHNHKTSRTTQWLLLPASGAALYALLKSDAFSRQARGAMDEAKARASELPDDRRRVGERGRRQRRQSDRTTATRHGVRGDSRLRTQEGEHVLKEGDVVCFPRGKDGAHQIINRTDSPIRVLMLSSMIRGEIIEYLDTGKVLAKDVEDEDIMFARPGPTVEYWEGED